MHNAKATTDLLLGHRVIRSDNGRDVGAVYVALQHNVHLHVVSNLILGERKCKRTRATMRRSTCTSSVLQVKFKSIAG